MRRWIGLALGIAGLSGAGAGCGGGGGGGGQGPSVSIAKGGAPNGDAQTAVVGSALPVLLKVLVQEDGAPKVGATVNWSAGGTGASVNPTSSTTDAAGEATTTWTLGTVSGGQTAQAALSGASGSPVGFSATATAGPATAFTKTAGDNQSGVVSTAFTTALSVKVADQFGNGIAGVTVDWSVQSGSLTLSGGATSVTNASGIASKSLTAGATPGAGVVRASTTSVAGTNLDFNLTVTLAPVRVTAGNFFFRSVKNGTEDPAIDTAQVNQPVRWSVSGTHTVRPVNGDFTGSPGNLNTGDTFDLSFNSTGTYEYFCSIHGAAEMSGRIVVIP